MKYVVSIGSVCHQHLMVVTYVMFHYDPIRIPDVIDFILFLRSTECGFLNFLAFDLKIWDLGGTGLCILETCESGKGKILKNIFLTNLTKPRIHNSPLVISSTIVSYVASMVPHLKDVR